MFIRGRGFWGFVSDVSFTLQAQLSRLESFSCDLSLLISPNGQGFDGHHHNAINWARRDAQVTARAPIREYGVHFLIGADDRIHWAGLYAKRAPNTVLFFNHGNLKRFVTSAIRVYRADWFV